MKKLYKILSIILIIMISLPVVEVQANSFKLNVSANKTEIKAGDTVELTINLSDVNVGDLGVNTIEWSIEYDNTIFEEITSSNIQSLNNWSISHNNEETEYKGKMIAVILDDGVTQNQNIGKITFKVKTGVKDVNTSIKVKDIVTNNGNVRIEDADKEIQFKVGTVVDNSQTNTTIKENTTVVKPENTSPDSLPKTGNLNYVLGVVGISLIIIARIVYVRYRDIYK